MTATSTRSRRAGCATAVPARPHLPRLAAGRHHAHLRVRRGAVLRLPAVALVRSRRVVRERVPAFLRCRHRRGAGLSRDLPRAHDRNRPAHQLRHDRLRAAVGAVLRGRRRRGAQVAKPADGGVAVRRLLAAVRRGGRRTRRRSTGCCALLLSAAAVRLLARWWPALATADGARGADRLDRHAAALLHVHRAADVARDVGLRGRAVSRRLAARPRRRGQPWRDGRCSARSPP